MPANKNVKKNEYKYFRTEQFMIFSPFHFLQTCSE